MPKLPMVKDRDFIRVLKKLGFFECPERGSSHIMFRHQDGRRAIISRHAGKDIPKGTLQGIMKDIRLSVKEFQKLLQK
jgi:predicted RNA binding protein YcfA (HicA-like mRNA interferase family)